jgi:hypothetical protein
MTAFPLSAFLALSLVATSLPSEGFNAADTGALNYSAVATISPDNRAQSEAAHAAKWNRMRPDQKARARKFKLFQSGSPLQPGITVIEDVLEGTGPTLEQRFCEAPSVFAGRVVDSTPLPTEDGSAVFTDYTIEITRSLRGPTLTARDRVIVARPGGTINEPNYRAAFHRSDFPSLKQGGEYLFFVEKDVDATDPSLLPAYLDLSSKSTKRLNGTDISPIDETLGGRPKSVPLTQLNNIICR